MGFVFDRTAEGRVIKSLTIVDDATHEECGDSRRTIGKMHLTHILDQLAKTCRQPKTIRTNTGKEYYSRAMLSRAHARGVQRYLIELSKPNQNAFIESFNRRFRDECPNEHWLTTCTTPCRHRRLAAGIQRQKALESSWRFEAESLR